ncbi:MAG: flippase-like domain-containing protein [Gemmatimonadetes bacterium]|nr:flippase-like domain-containing protein [Gemmatimonadota bacterium]
MRKHVRTVIGIALSVLLLGWALRDVSPAAVAHEIRNVDPLLFIAAIVLTLCGFWFRAVRWGIFLLPTGRVPFRPRFASTLIGFAANNILPARIGEFARALSLTKLTEVRLGTSLATLVVERLFDAIVVIGLLFAAMSVPSFPAGTIAGVDPRVAARVIALLMFGVGLALGVLVVAPRRSIALAERISNAIVPERARHPLLGALRSFIGGLAVLRSGRLFLVSLVLATAQWLFTALSFLVGFRAFDIQDVGLAGALFLQSLIALSVAIPSSPGFFGPFEAAAKLGLGLWEVDSDKAISFAVGFHLGGFIPTTLIGLYYVWRLNLSWSQVKHSEEMAEEAVGNLETVAASGDPDVGSEER